MKIYKVFLPFLRMVVAAAMDRERNSQEVSRVTRVTRRANFQTTNIFIFYILIYILCLTFSYLSYPDSL